MKPSNGKKGLVTEELLREYFLQAGFYVVRGAKLRYEQTELTDVDLWIYERSATLARRRTIVDIKDKQRPQASERMFFVMGLARIIGVEGVGVATTDKNVGLRNLARKNKVLWIDGEDLQRLKSSDKLLSGQRLSEEEFQLLVDGLDKQRGGRQFRTYLDAMKSSVVDRFGASSANLALETFTNFAHQAIKAHPKSVSAAVLTRLTFLSASFAAAALDFASADSALRPLAERRKHMANAIRFGENMEGTYKKLEWADMALREYFDNGSSLSKQIKEGFNKDINQIPADDLADVVVRLSHTNSLFDIARKLDHAAYSREQVSFDSLPNDVKSLVGALLDFCRLERKLFAAAFPVGEWRPSDLDSAADGDAQGDLQL